MPSNASTEWKAFRSDKERRARSAVSALWILETDRQRRPYEPGPPQRYASTNSWCAELRQSSQLLSVSGDIPKSRGKASITGPVSASIFVSSFTLQSGLLGHE
jgi:hypothetical protein